MKEEIRYSNPTALTNSQDYRCLITSLKQRYLSARLKAAQSVSRELLQNSELRKALSELQSKTYGDCNVLKSELLGEHVITEMLNKFIGCMFSQDVKTKEGNDEEKHILETKSAAGKLYALISPNYKRVFNCQQDEVPKDSYQRFQLVVDYLSGMTDSYIVDLYNELTNSKY